MLKQIVSLLVAVSMILSLGTPVCAVPKPQTGFAGIEFYGSSQVSRSELDRYLGLKPGARLEQISKAVDRLNKKLAERHINSYVEIVEGGPSTVYVVVSVSDSQSDAAPTRHLKHPRHVQLTTDKPLLLLDELDTRLEKLSDGGRPWSEQLRSGLKYYTDEPANQIVEQETQLVPGMRDELIAVVESDPDPSRRRRAIQLLSWAGSIPDTSRRILPALDDADPSVRVETARYLFPRMELLPDDFPYDQLLASFSRLLNRPTHQDRSKALYCLLALCSQHPDLIGAAKDADEEKVKNLASTSQLQSIKAAADQLLARFANPPTIPQRANSEGGYDASGF
jgi:hypothetical protein